MRKISQKWVPLSWDYANRVADYLSENHDAIGSTREDRVAGMYAGKLGEGYVKDMLDYYGIPYLEDEKPDEDPDNFDLLIGGKKVDVKTKRSTKYTDLIEMVEQVKNRPKDLFINVHVNVETLEAEFIGWTTNARMLEINKIVKMKKVNYVVRKNEQYSQTAVRPAKCE